MQEGRYRNYKPLNDMESPTEEKYHQNREQEGEPRLVSVETENVDASGVDDNSTGMHDDDYLGKSNKEDN